MGLNPIHSNCVFFLISLNSKYRFGLDKFDNALSADRKGSRWNVCITLVYIVIVSVEEFDNIDLWNTNINPTF